MKIKVLLIATTAMAMGSSAVIADDNIRGRTIGVTCAGCHGTDGIGGTAIPPLKGRDAAYMESAMTEYKDGTRSGTIMPRIAKGYTEADIKAVAAYFANLQDTANGEAK